MKLWAIIFLAVVQNYRSITKKMLVTFFVDKIHGYKLPLGYQQFQVDRLRKTLSDDVYDEYVNNINQEMSNKK